MCRFVFYQGAPIRISSLIKEPRHSLIHQSFSSKMRRGPLNGDGFGLAWYQQDLSSDPALFRSIKPAWNDQNLIELSRIIVSSCVLAHIRAATQHTEVSELNCHPFKYHKFAFMHNGDIGGFPYFKRELCDYLSEPFYHSIRGTTDSEHFFALLMHFMKRHKDQDRSVRMFDAMNDTIGWFMDARDRHSISDHFILNVVFTDGNSSVTVRFSTEEFSESLYMTVGNHYECEGDRCYMVSAGLERGATLVSSEPLSMDEQWKEVPKNTITLIENGVVREQLKAGSKIAQIF